MDLYHRNGGMVGRRRDDVVDGTPQVQSRAAVGRVKAAGPGDLRRVARLPALLALLSARSGCSRPHFHHGANLQKLQTRAVPLPFCAACAMPRCFRHVWSSTILGAKTCLSFASARPCAFRVRCASYYCAPPRANTIRPNKRVPNGPHTDAAAQKQVAIAPSGNTLRRLGRLPCTQARPQSQELRQSAHAWPRGGRLSAGAEPPPKHAA